jgi:hypothetical protein
VVKEQGWLNLKTRTDQRKAYEVENVNDLWVCDFMHGPQVASHQKRFTKAILCTILDDHSRMVAGHAFSSSETISVLTLEPFNQRIAMRYHMPGLSLEETKNYVTHHLKLAGAMEPLLSDQALQAVHEVSFGIPRKIGAVTEAALTYAMFDQKRTVSPEMVLKVKTLEG